MEFLRVSFGDSPGTNDCLNRFGGEMSPGLSALVATAQRREQVIRKRGM
jgi:hypothetical protein